MRVILAEQLFADDYPDPLGLASVIQLAQDGRHQFLLRPSFDRDGSDDLPRTRWLGLQHPRTRQQLEELLTTSARDASSGSPATMTVTVVAEGPSNWNTLVLALEDARVLLTAPLKVRLENRSADWAFLRALAPPHRRRELDEAEDRGWLEVLGVGGVDEMWKFLETWRPLVEADETALAPERAGTWIMFDRDADVDASDPLSPSPRHESLRELCATLELRHQPLHRRTIESYLPVEALAGPHPSSNSADQARLAALRRLRDAHPAEAYSLSVKEGILKDAQLSKRDRNTIGRKWLSANPETRVEICREHVDAHLPAAWRALPEALRAELLWGFGSRCAERFALCDVEPRWETWFQSEYDRGPAAQPCREVFISSVLDAL